MSACDRQDSGVIELYFYGELDAPECAAVERHISMCAECHQALEELTTIRAALATRPDVAAPPGGDWGPFMARLDQAMRLERVDQTAVKVGPLRTVTQPAARPRSATYVAMAALVTLITMSVVYFVRTRTHQATEAPVATRVTPADTPVAPVPAPAAADRSAEAAFAALSEQHFERSKLVVLGLTSKDPRRTRESEWAYERQLASTLLNDTRLYRLAAEERGMTTIARVMGDLEMVLLQTSLAETPDSAALAQIQRLINKRDLVARMELAGGL
jgi:hypothetical protein